MELSKPPQVDERDERPTLGIRKVTPFRGMLKVRDELLNDLDTWLDTNGVGDVGPAFLRLHVVDMAGDMDIEVGVVTDGSIGGDGRITAGSWPAGRYATLTYRDHAMRANKTLIQWATDHGVTFDRSETPKGDNFACRYEAYLTDRRQQPRKTKWEVELSIRTAD